MLKVELKLINQSCQVIPDVGGGNGPRRQILVQQVEWCTVPVFSRHFMAIRLMVDVFQSVGINAVL